MHLNYMKCVKKCSIAEAGWKAARICLSIKLLKGHHQKLLEKCENSQVCVLTDEMQMVTLIF